MTRRTISELCSTYNYATNPAAFRNDHEHNRNGALARAVKARMRRLGLRPGRDYIESYSSGRYRPVQS